MSAHGAAARAVLRLPHGDDRSVMLRGTELARVRLRDKKAAKKRQIGDGEVTTVKGGEPWEGPHPLREFTTAQLKRDIGHAHRAAKLVRKHNRWRRRKGMPLHDDGPVKLHIRCLRTLLRLRRRHKRVRALSSIISDAIGMELRAAVRRKRTVAATAERSRLLVAKTSKEQKRGLSADEAAKIKTNAAKLARKVARADGRVEALVAMQKAGPVGLVDAVLRGEHKDPPPPESAEPDVIARAAILTHSLVRDFLAEGENGNILYAPINRDDIRYLYEVHASASIPVPDEGVDADEPAPKLASFTLGEADEFDSGDEEYAMTDGAKFAAAQDVLWSDDSSDDEGGGGQSSESEASDTGDGAIVTDSDDDLDMLDRKKLRATVVPSKRIDSSGTSDDKDATEGGESQSNSDSDSDDSSSSGDSNSKSDDSSSNNDSEESTNMPTAAAKRRFDDTSNVVVGLTEPDGGRSNRKRRRTEPETNHESDEFKIKRASAAPSLKKVAAEVKMAAEAEAKAKERKLLKKVLAKRGKNRLGQRQRRELIERALGERAEVAQKQQQMLNRRGSGGHAKHSSKDTSRATGGHVPSRDPRPALQDPAGRLESGSASAPFKSSTANAAASWEAKKQLQRAAATAKFAGKKITFD